MHSTEGRVVVSVPLPGFSGLRRERLLQARLRRASFSPVAGIQWVETGDRGFGRYSGLRVCFSPVAGIQWVETTIVSLGLLSGVAVSVPLPGFSGLRHGEWIGNVVDEMFQSRCRDSVG